MDSSRNQILITGAGLVSPLGLTFEQTWTAILAGRNGMGPLTALESAPPGGAASGGQAPDLPADFAPGLPREVRYLRWALDHAWRDAGLEAGSPYAAGRCAMLLGTTLHGMRAAGRYFRSGEHGQFRDFLASSITAQMQSTQAIGGLTATVCSACSSSLGSIALGVTLLESGQADLVIAGGYDTISEYVYAGFNSLRLVTDGPLRPFARDRRGMKVAEGYALVILERAPDARRRGARVLANILGWGESADAHHLTQPHPRGEGAARAVEQAMARARLTPSDIGLIAAHATGTPDNDASEHAAFARAMGEQISHIPIVAFKSHLGHTLGAAGAVELVLSALALRDQIVPACANVTADEVEFDDLCVVTGAARPGKLAATLNTSLGFGGANTCVILGAGEGSPNTAANPTRLPVGSVERAPDAPVLKENPDARSADHDRGAGFANGPADRAANGPQKSRFESLKEPGVADGFSTDPTRDTQRGSREVLITGIGVVLPGAIGNEALIARIRGGGGAVFERDSHTLAPADFEGLLQARRVRRMGHYVKLTLAATTLACRDAAIADLPAFANDCAAVLGSMHGGATYSTEYYQQIVREGLLAANPALFAEAVPNAAAAQLSLMLSLRGACQTVIGSRTAGLDALALAALRIRSGAWDRAIVSAGEEACELVHDVYRHCGLAAANPAAAFTSEGGFAMGEGAVTFILESRRVLDARGGRALGRIESSAVRTASPAHAAASAAQVLEQLAVPAVISSACATWVDRSESMALRRWGKAGRVSTIYGHFAETFSASPLIAIAAALLGEGLPPLIGDGWRDDRISAATGNGGEPERSFATLCTDFDGSVSGVSVTRLSE